MTKEQICAPGYAASVKATKESTRVEAFSRYGLRDGKSMTEVLDHLIPVELGGTDDVENLWPEPAKGEWSAAQKDALEQKLLATGLRRHADGEAGAVGDQEELGAGVYPVRRRRGHAHRTVDSAASNHRS